MLVQASMTYVETSVGQDLADVNSCFPNHVRDEFTAMKPLYLPGITTCSVPGVLLISKAPAQDTKCFGEMSSQTSGMVKHCRDYAYKCKSPLSQFLDICAQNDLCLNKYLVGAQQKI